MVVRMSFTHVFQHALIVLVATFLIYCERCLMFADLVDKVCWRTLFSCSLVFLLILQHVLGFLHITSLHVSLLLTFLTSKKLYAYFTISSWPCSMKQPTCHLLHAPKSHVCISSLFNAFDKISKWCHQDHVDNMVAPLSDRLITLRPLWLLSSHFLLCMLLLEVVT